MLYSHLSDAWSIFRWFDSVIVGFNEKFHRPGLKGFNFLFSVIVGFFFGRPRFAFSVPSNAHGASSDIGRFGPKSFIGF